MAALPGPAPLAGGGRDADDHIGRQHAARRRGDRDRTDVLDPAFVGVLRHGGRPVRGRQRHLEHLHEAGAAGALGRVPGDLGEEERRVHLGRPDRARGPGARLSCCWRRSSRARRSRVASGNGIGRMCSRRSGACSASRPSPGWTTARRSSATDTIDLVSRRWIRLTWTTLLSQLALFLILLLSLRHLGVSEQEVSTAEAFAVFSFGRLISALPITPGGLGVIELGYIGGLVGRRRGQGRRRRRRPVVPHPHVRDPDPARGVHVPDLAGEDELAPGAARGERASGLGGRSPADPPAIEHQRRDLVHHRERAERDPRSEEHAGDHVGEPVGMQVDP